MCFWIFKTFHKSSHLCKVCLQILTDSCLKTWYTLHCWEVYLNLFWLAAGPKIEQQQPGLKFSLNITRYWKNTAAISLYIISATRSKKKFRARVQVEDIKTKSLIPQWPEQQNLMLLKPTKAMLFDWTTPKKKDFPEARQIR